ncbi:MAG: hypothetical protein V4505_02740 [Pseudomonadota bacterium]
MPAPLALRPAALLLSATLLFPPAQAQTPEGDPSALVAPSLPALPLSSASPVDRILGRTPPACTEAAFELLVRQMRADAPRVVLEGIGRARHMGAEWAPGNPGYDRVRAIVAGAFDGYEKASGPLVPFDYRHRLEQAFGALRPDDRAFLADFFDRPAGRLYWDQVLGGAECTGTLQAVAADRLSFSDRTAYNHLQQQAEAAHGLFLSGMTALSTTERQDFADGFARMGKGVVGGGTQAMEQIGKAIETNARLALQPRQADIRAALDAYAAAGKAP